MNQLLTLIKSKLLSIKFVAESGISPTKEMFDEISTDADKAWGFIRNYELHQITCKYMESTGMCKFGDGCWFSHDLTSKNNSKNVFNSLNIKSENYGNFEQKQRQKQKQKQKQKYRVSIIDLNNINLNNNNSNSNNETQ